MVRLVRPSVCPFVCLSHGANVTAIPSADEVQSISNHGSICELLLLGAGGLCLCPSSMFYCSRCHCCPSFDLLPFLSFC